MRLLLDNNLSFRLVPILADLGWDALHVQALSLRAAPDELVLQAARDDHRILVSADTDFGALLAASRATARRSYSCAAWSAAGSKRSPDYWPPTCHLSTKTCASGA